MKEVGFLSKNKWGIIFISLAVLLVSVTVFAVTKENPVNVEQLVPSFAASKENRLDGAITVSKDGINGELTPGVPLVSVYYDYACPYCKGFAESTEIELEQLARDGKINLEFRVVSILDTYSFPNQYSTRAANASISVAENHPDKWLAFNQALFSTQPASQETGNNLTDKQIREVAISAGLSDSEAREVTKLHYANWVTDRSVAELRNGLEVVPELRVDGVRVDLSEFNVNSLLE